MLDKWYWQVEIKHNKEPVFSDTNANGNVGELEHDACFYYRDALAAANVSQSRYTLGGHPFDEVNIEIWKAEQ